MKLYVWEVVVRTMRDENPMKKMVIVLILLTSLLLFAAASSYSVINDQSTCTIDQAVDNGIEATGDVAGRTEVDGVISETGTVDPQTAVNDSVVQKQVTEEEEACPLTENALAKNSYQDDWPIPDGRIYDTPEGPYPYIPTCTTKGPWEIPFTPLEPVN